VTPSDGSRRLIGSRPFFLLLLLLLLARRTLLVMPAYSRARHLHRESLPLAVPARPVLLGAKKKRGTPFPTTVKVSRSQRELPCTPGRSQHIGSE
jgi:hypothetical protein